MAYMSKENKKALAPAIKAVLAKYKMKGTISVRHHMALVVKLKSGDIDFKHPNQNVNVHCIALHHEGEEAKFLLELCKAMNIGNHNNSDVQTDYFDVGWYCDINLGTDTANYKYTGNKA